MFQLSNMNNIDFFLEINTYRTKIIKFPRMPSFQGCRGMAHKKKLTTAQKKLTTTQKKI